MSKKHEKYLTIGTLARLTGVHVKSLRYYDEIGVLPPAFVDPETGYRYYSQQQVILVDAIQLCVELDIPLKQFQIFLADNKHQILFSQLIEYGTQLANAKIEVIHKKLDHLEEMRKEINRGESLPQDGQPLCYNMAQELCCMVPYQGKWGSADFYSVANSLYLEIKAAGWKVGYEMGLLTVYSCGQGPRQLCLEEEEEAELAESSYEGSHNRRKQHIRQYVFIEVSGLEADGEQGKQPGKVPEIPYLYRIPEGKYLCRRKQCGDEQDPAQLFPELFREDYDKIVVEVELYAGDYHMLHPEFEIRCSMPETFVYP